MQTIKYPTKETWNNILKRPSIDTRTLESTVEQILSDIKANGQSAVNTYTLQFDKVNVKNVLVTADEFAFAETQISEDLKKAIQLAKNNIEAFHSAQKESVNYIETMPGVRCWRKSVPIQKVGLYIPGGTAPLFSTILMLGIPAKLAGDRKSVV